jgi:hypothetical protein
METVKIICPACKYYTDTHYPDLKVVAGLETKTEHIYEFCSTCKSKKLVRYSSVKPLEKEITMLRQDQVWK